MQRFLTLALTANKDTSASEIIGVMINTDELLSWETSSLARNTMIV